MVISDGAPVDDSTLSANPGNYLEKHLREVITWIETRSDVELLAIGIGHDVTRYYRRAVTISDPEQLGGVMLATTALAYLWLRPRQRDVFWDIRAAAASKNTETNGLPERPEEPRPPVENTEDFTRYQTELLDRADFLYEEANHARALRYYESGLSLGQARPIVYHRAALAASQCNNPARALALLERAVQESAGGGINGVMWYNMGCFATRLGRFDQAMKYLQRAVAAGFCNAEKYEKDTDLSPLRWRDDFKALVRSLFRDAAVPHG